MKILRYIFLIKNFYKFIQLFFFRQCCERLMQSNKNMGDTKIKSLKVSQRWKIRTITVHILVMIFGISAWIGVNGIFIQLPLLVNILPESWGLAVHLVVIIQAANVAPVIYSFLRKSSFKISESLCILIMLGIGSLVMGLMIFLYDKTSIIAGKHHSTGLFILTFFIAAVSCSSSVLFMPYLRNFKEIYLVSYFIGEGLGGVLPSVVALIQGVGESMACENSSNNTLNLEKTFPRFSSHIYFMFIFICLILSLIAFLLLENLSYIKKEKISLKNSGNSASENETENCHCEEKVSVLPQSSTSKHDNLDNKDIFSDDYNKTDAEKFSNMDHTQNRNHKELNNLYLFILLSIICLLANGLLPSIQPYSCLSYGNMSYHLSVTFSQIANPTACLLALWYLPQSTKIINWLAVVILIVSCYVLNLALSSPNPPLKNSKIGKILVILSWTILLGLISYVKLIIIAVFRRKSEQKLFHVGVVIQVGSACGAVLSFILINFTTLLHEYNPC